MTTTPTLQSTAQTLGVAVLTAGLVACGGSESTVTRDPGAAPPAQTLATTRATVGDLAATFEAGGIVRARATAAVAARVMAPVVSVHVRTGDSVKRGATLVTLDARELTAHATRGKASTLAAEEAVQAAGAQMQAVEAGWRLAKATHDRITGLHEKQSATAQELDQAVAALHAAEAQVNGAGAQRAAAAAALDAARAAANVADIGLSYTTLTAPFDGTVASRTVDPGAMAAPGMPLLVIEQVGGNRLEATIDEARAAQVRVGQPVEVRLDDSRGEWQQATVTEIGRLDASSHSFLVKIDLPSGAGQKTGAFGRVRFAGAPRRALTVPAASIIRRGQLAFVFVVGPERLARLRPVTPGPVAGDRAEILAGLTDGEAVVAAPPPDLRDGTPLTGASARAPESQAEPVTTAAGGRQ